MNARTPVQWTDQEFAGFSDSKPWMRVNDNYPEINVAKEIDDKDSLLNFNKKLLQIRNQYKDLFVYGEFKMLDLEDKKLFKFVKSNGARKAFVILNFSTEEVDFTNDKGKLLISNQNSQDDVLKPYEGRIYIE